MNFVFFYVKGAAIELQQAKKKNSSSLFSGNIYCTVKMIEINNRYYLCVWFISFEPAMVSLSFLLLDFGHLKSGTTFLDYNFSFTLSAFVKGRFEFSLGFSLSISLSLSLFGCGSWCGCLSIAARIPTQKNRTMHMLILHIYYFSTNTNNTSLHIAHCTDAHTMRWALRSISFAKCTIAGPVDALSTMHNSECNFVFCYWCTIWLCCFCNIVQRG